MGLFEFILFIALGLGLAYKRVAQVHWIPILAVALLFEALWGHISSWFFIPLLLITLSTVFILNIKQLRLRYLTLPLWRRVTRLLPPMSQTEKIALEAGDVWWEAELFCGRPNWQRLLSFKKPTLNNEEQAFLDHQVEKLCLMVNDWEISHEEKALSSHVWDYLKQEGFFGIIIPKHYGGLGFSALAHSAIVTKLATRSASVAVTAMVPNSLGPAELLLQYGTEEQKDKYLPALAKGEEIPCFALTGPEAGSDAAAIPDTGIICKGTFEGKVITGIKLNWNKRYITLAPVATVLGLAFKLYDPEHLLSEQEDIGITLCLIPTTHAGVEVGKRHMPHGMAFMNGPTQGQDVFIPLDWIIGGQERMGQGWQMLMECLSVGRAISLPALGAATNLLSYRMTGAYAAIRKQFRVSISEFEGVQAALARIAGFTYMTEALRQMTATAVDLGIKPTVASAITKYHATELARKVVMEAMDIHGGRALQLGPRNYMSPIYQSIPMSITVEGANILTRNLIIFGQGAIRCHPYLLQEMEAAQNQNQKSVETFDHLLMEHLGYTVSNLAGTFLHGLTGGLLAEVPGQNVVGKTSIYYRRISHLSAALAFVSDITMLMLGGALKRKEALSARLGDVLSYLYISTAMLKRYYDLKREPLAGSASLDAEQEDLMSQELYHLDWGIQYCLAEAQKAMSDFFANFPRPILAKFMHWIVFPRGKRYHYPSDKLNYLLAKTMVCPSPIRQHLTQDCFVTFEKEDITGRMENAFIKLFAAKNADKKLQTAIRHGHIPRDNNFEAQLAIAARAHILNENEVELLTAAHCAYIDAIQVDAFQFDLSKAKE